MSREVNLVDCVFDTPRRHCAFSYHLHFSVLSISSQRLFYRVLGGSVVSMMLGFGRKDRSGAPEKWKWRSSEWFIGLVIGYATFTVSLACPVWQNLYPC